ncbi:MAG: extracellular solute-binding protein [Pseudomonadota bacterium]
MINRPAIKALFSALVELKEAGLSEWYGAGRGDNAKHFEKGKVAIRLGSSGSFGGLLKKVDFAFSATIPPYWEAVTAEPTQTFMGGAALFAMAGKSAEENKATAEFFRSLTSANVEFFWHKATRYVLITEAAYDVAKDAGHDKEFPAADVGIQQLSLDAGEFTKGYLISFYVQIRDVMNRD